MTRIVSILMCFGLCVAVLDEAGAATYYVRPDGGNAQQCDGRSDAPYPGRGQAQACAWQHPFFALPPGGQPRIEGGDTLVIGAGQYRMGIGAPGSGHCNPAYSWDCHMPPVPAGLDADHPTRILGVGYDTGCPAPPTLWGAERAALIVDLSRADHVQLACLELTDRSGCIEFHCHGGDCGGDVQACERDRSPFGPWASTGIFAADADDVRLADLRIHGLAGRGIQAGRISDWHLERVRLLANGWAGWDGDIGADSSNHGRIHFEDVEIGYNGCARAWPQLGVHGCWAQGAGGYGDGLGTARTGGEWVFERVRVHHNTSDGLDLAYFEGDAPVIVDASLFEGNAGNQIKIAGSASISNSIVIANCGYFTGNGNFASTDHCRAGGDAIFLGIGPGVDSRLVNNSITGEGNCLVSSAGEAGGRLLFANNLFVGQRAHGRGRPTCHFYSDQARVETAWRANLVVGTHRGVCSPGNLCLPRAGIRGADIDDFDPTPLPDSPLIGAALSSDPPGADFWGLPRRLEGPHTIGAIESTGHTSALRALRHRLQRDDDRTGAVGAGPNGDG